MQIKGITKFKNYFKFTPKTEYYKTPDKNVPTDVEQYIKELQDFYVKNPNYTSNAKAMSPRLQRGLDLTIGSILYPFLMLGFQGAKLITKIANPKESSMYVTKRIGEKGKLVLEKKIHTMNSLPDGTHELSNFAIFLRKHCVDEFAQIKNVVNGSFSLFGPRPLDNKGLYNLAKENGKDYVIWRMGFKPGFGFGYDKGRMLPQGKKLKELEQERLAQITPKTYFENVWNLVKTVLRGNNG